MDVKAVVNDIKTQAFKARIQRKEAKIAVIGLGYVGLAQAVMFANAGFLVAGIDIDNAKIGAINAGHWPLDPNEPELPAMMQEALALDKLYATSDFAACHDADIVIVAVPTPINEDKQPDFSALIDALTNTCSYLGKPALICIESTLAPGAMADLAAMFGEPGYYLAYCPERVTPGKLAYNLRTVPRIIGADPDASILAMALYSQICKASLCVTDPLSAEVCKCAENAYRDVQLAFANELALTCEDLGADVWTVRQLINTCPGRNVLRPGPGVGGACIGKDTWLLMSDLTIVANLLTAARAANDWMPDHVTGLVVEVLRNAKIAASDAIVALLGMAYKENTSDVRNSPTVPIAAWLQQCGIAVCIHDPHVVGYDSDVVQTLRGADCAVILVGHNEYLGLDWRRLGVVMRNKVLVDARGIVPEAPEGFVFKRLGDGTT